MTRRLACLSVLLTACPAWWQPAGAGDEPSTTAAATTAAPDPTTTTTTESSSTAFATSSGSPTSDPVITGTTNTTDTTTGPFTCERHSECLAINGDGFFCIEGACVNALTIECQKLTLPASGDPDKLVLLGSIIPASDPHAPLTLPLQHALQLAIADYNKTTDLPGGHGIAWLSCDDNGQIDRAIAAAEHLSGALKVPAIVGPIFSEQVIAVAEQVTIPAGTFLISPTATARDITTLEDDDNLVWRTITSDAYQANAIADRALELDMPTVTKLVLLSKEDAYGDGLADDIFARLILPLDTGLKTYAYPDPTTLPPDELKLAYAVILAQAYGAKGQPHPDTLVIAGTSEARDFVLGTILLWADEDPPIPLPRFIVSHGAVPILEDIINHPNILPQLKQPLMAVIEGTAPVISDPDNFASFNARYKLVFDGADALTACAPAYDAGMVVMLAMAAVPQGEPITGAAIRDNIAKLQDPAGTKVSFSEIDGQTITFIQTAHDALVTGLTVDLEGISGELTFDLVTGEPRTDLIGWGLDPSMGDPNTPVLTPKRLYLLQAQPSEQGQWIDL